MSVSVVIPNYNGVEVLKKHLPDVLSAVSKVDEVIVVDDASTDNSVEFLIKHFPRVKVVQNITNLRFAQSCNRGVLEATNEIVVLLNSDVSPEKEFLAPLMKHFDNPNVFAVGCLEIGEGSKESGRSVATFKRGMLSHRRAPNQHKPFTLWAAGGSMAVRKSLWLELGGMDALFRPAYKEDIDVSYRAWKAGYEVHFEPHSRVHHVHETTNTIVLGKKVIEVTSYKNEFLFLWKNLTDWKLRISHFLWLYFYILPILGWKTRGHVIQGYFAAKRQSAEMIVQREKVKKLWKLGDAEVLQKVGQ